MAGPDPKELVPLFPDFPVDPKPEDVALYIAAVASQAMAAASLDPPGTLFEAGPKAPGHLAAVGLVIAAGNYAWMKFDPEISAPIVAFTTQLLKQLGVPDVHGWRPN